MKNKATSSTLFLLLLYLNIYGQDLSVAGYYYAGQNGAWLQLNEQLAATRYLGTPERLEIEVMGGYYSAFNKVTYLIKARNGIEVVKIIENGDIAGHELKIYDTGTADNVSDRYIVGIKIPANSWFAIAVRAKELRTRNWVTISNTTEPSLPLVNFEMLDNDNVVQNVDGNIGIGTTSPTSKLAVNGTTKTKEIIVTEQSNDWPDYVFNEEYPLPDLSELESYILKNKRLPDIPSSNDILIEGQNLGAIQLELLKKVEEITLLMIHQEKENRLLREEINVLQQKIKKME